MRVVGADRTGSRWKIGRRARLGATRHPAAGDRDRAELRHAITSHAPPDAQFSHKPRTHGCRPRPRHRPRRSPPPRRTGRAVEQPRRARNSSATRAMRRCLPQVTAAAPPPNGLAGPRLDLDEHQACRRAAPRCRFRHAACGTGARELRTRGAAIRGTRVSSPQFPKLPRIGRIAIAALHVPRRPARSADRSCLARVRGRRLLRASSACPPGRPRAGCRVRRATPEWRRRRRSRAAAGRPSGPRSAARSPPPAPAGVASSARRRLTTPSTRSMSSIASRTSAASSADTCFASMAAVHVAHQVEDRRQRAGGVEVALECAAERRRAASTNLAVTRGIRGLARSPLRAAPGSPRSGAATPRPGPCPAQVKLSCLR